jgi:hypothetical protein
MFIFSICHDATSATQINQKTISIPTGTQLKRNTGPEEFVIPVCIFKKDNTSTSQ